MSHTPSNNNSVHGVSSNIHNPNYFCSEFGLLFTL